MAEKVSLRGICKRCGKKLKNPDFIKIGYGKTCYEKMCRKKAHFKNLFDERMVISSGKNRGKKK